VGREATRGTGDRIGRASRTRRDREDFVRGNDRPTSRACRFPVIDDREDGTTYESSSCRGYRQHGYDDASLVVREKRGRSEPGLVNNYARECRCDEESAVVRQRARATRQGSRRRAG
jgi:hypothetical protein